MRSYPRERESEYYGHNWPRHSSPTVHHLIKTAVQEALSAAPVIHHVTPAIPVAPAPAEAGGQVPRPKKKGKKNKKIVKKKSPKKSDPTESFSEQILILLAAILSVFEKSAGHLGDAHPPVVRPLVPTPPAGVPGTNGQPKSHTVGDGEPGHFGALVRPGDHVEREER